MVGQLAYSLTPCLMFSSESTSNDPNSIPKSSRMLTTCAEKPHCGSSGVPFINKNTLTELIFSSIIFFVSGFILGCPGLDFQGMYLLFHLFFQGIIDHLVLFDQTFSGEAFVCNYYRKMRS